MMINVTDDATNVSQNWWKMGTECLLDIKVFQTRILKPGDFITNNWRKEISKIIKVESEVIPIG